MTVWGEARRALHPLVNHLADETSPYLRQHAENPVEWFPWGDEALQRRRSRTGRSSCPSGTPRATGATSWRTRASRTRRPRPTLKWFVSVKVDREERPDIDALYMAATQAPTGSGGWPMSVFCTPDGRPVLRRDLLPPGGRQGMPSFRRVVEALGEAWVTDRANVLDQADALVGALRQEMCLAEAVARRRPPVRRHPVRLVGASTAPDSTRPRSKSGWSTALPPVSTPSGAASGPLRNCPGPPSSSSASARPEGGPMRWRTSMALRTLDAMATGGIYDHLVGGFCRYDRRAVARPSFREDADRPGIAVAGLFACVAGRSTP